MLFAQLGQNQFLHYLVISFAVVLRAPAVDSQTISLTCDTFVRKETASCMCKVKTSPRALTTTTATTPTTNDTNDTNTNINTNISTTTGSSVPKITTGTCGEDEKNAAYITIGEEPDIEQGSPFKGSAGSECLCCYKDFHKEERQSPVLHQTPGTTCQVRRSTQKFDEINISFLVSEKVAKLKSVYCVLPCLPGRANITVRLMENVMVPTKSLSMLIIIVASSVGGIIALAVLTLVLAYFMVQYQRRQAWIIYENKPTRPAPLPTVQNSGLIYIVDPRGLVLPLLEKEHEEVAASDKGPGMDGGAPRSKKRSSERPSVQVGAVQENRPEKEPENIVVVVPPLEGV